MNEVIQNVMEYLTTALIVVGVLAFVTSVIVQSIKEMPGLKDVPTELIALVIAELVTIVATLAGCNYFKILILWYYVVAAVIAGFFVYMIATGGWEKLRNIWERTKYSK
ncbi:ribonuclease [Oribacterium sp. C9]|uniref:ribonuclease n=1 Tax=Oribacterium sp. C9 TaxID=1943579 RepID=UPI00098F2879|nr:ribonuclease [Oribacterium sp. C9]OON87614.1 ribonuclease [Oribacterium sp. C9]OON87645.1 ribonuclease [Oribacterium sp. C9]